MSIKNIHIINGPNLNLLGKREPTIYGYQSFEDYLKGMQENFKGKASLHYFQSNSEGALIDHLHKVGFEADGIILNAGGYTHTSVAIRDAVSGIESPVIEVHISNIHERETFRHHSYLTDVCEEAIIGKGLKGYDLGVEKLLNKLSKKPH